MRLARVADDDLVFNRSIDTRLSNDPVEVDLSIYKLDQSIDRDQLLEIIGSLKDSYGKSELLK